MKTLILFYSRTGTTRKVAEKIAKILEADIEEISDNINRSGLRGYLISGKEAVSKKNNKINPITHDVSDYDLVIIGTPVWAWTMSSPVRSLITEQKDKFKKVAFFCTQGGEGNQGALSDMIKLSNKEPIATLSLLTKKVVRDEIEEDVDNFTKSLFSKL
jgi:flavodoxin